MTMLERMTPEQLADIRRVDAEIEIERQRRSAGNLWFLRVGINRDVLGFQIIALIVLMMGLFIFFEFLIELRLRRSVERRCSGERK